MTALSLELPPDVIETIAQRAATILAEQQADPQPIGFLDVAGAASSWPAPSPASTAWSAPGESPSTRTAVARCSTAPSCASTSATAARSAHDPD